MTKLNELKKRMLNNADVQQAYDDVADEFHLASAIIDARNAAGLTQEELAQRMKAKQSAIARIETGRQNITIKTLHKIAQATGTDLKISFE